MEYRVELRTVTSPDEVRLEDDPVRKGLDYHFRMTNGRRIFTIPEKAVVCTANTSHACMYYAILGSQCMHILCLQ